MPTKAAPGRLRTIQDFVNTFDVEEDRDSVATPAELAAWLQERGLLPEGAVDEADHALALQVREALRRLLLANGGGRAAQADLALLDRLAAESRLTPRFDAGAVRLEPGAGGCVGALGRLVAIVAEAVGEGTWSRLKACSDHGCQWAFYDRSKNRSGHWCSMLVCGNRAKARQFRERRRRSGAPAGG
jgi:predicted RNA-binding Zn ribbon-like protein